MDFNEFNRNPSSNKEGSVVVLQFSSNSNCESPSEETRTLTTNEDGSVPGTHELQTTVCEATSNMLKSACGPGCLSLALACSRVGVSLAPFVVITLQLCCVYNMHLLTLVKKHFESTGAKSYGDVAERVFGHKGRAIVEIFVSLQQLGICCVYFEFVASGTEGILINAGIDQGKSRWRLIQIMVLAYIIFAPLSLMRHWKKLVPLSVFSNFCICTGIGVVLCFTLQKLVSSGPSEHIPAVPSADSLVTSVPLLYGTVIYSFENICCILPIENAMADTRKVGQVIGASMFCYCFIMQLVAILPLIAFGHITEGSLPAYVARRYRAGEDRVWIIVMNVLVMIAVTLTYPIQFYPVCEVFENHCGIGAGQGAQSRHFEGQREGMGSNVIPQLSIFSSVHSNTERGSSLEHSTHSVSDCGGALVDSASFRSTTSCTCCKFPKSHRCVILSRLGLRFGLVCGTLVVAAAVPRLDLLISLFGSLNAPILAMILPPAMALKVLDPRQSDESPGLSRQPLHFLIVVLGIFASLAGTALSLQSIIAAFQS